MRALLLIATATAVGCLALNGGAIAQQPAPAKAPATPKAARPSTGPAWNDLSVAQKASLRPLEAQWGTLSEAQKRKWIALAQNYPKLSPDEQAKLHSRMTEWVALSPQQRTQARLNFADTQKIPADDRKAKWEAYQSLSAEEKSRLAAKAAPKTPGAAAAVKPVPAQKLAKVPPKPRHDQQARPAAPAAHVDHNTLLPQAGVAAQPAAVPVSN